jgi:hypothetical protein
MARPKNPPVNRINEMIIAAIVPMKRFAMCHGINLLSNLLLYTLMAVTLRIYTAAPIYPHNAINL